MWSSLGTEQRLVDGQRLGLDEQSIGRYHISGAEPDYISNDHINDWDRHCVGIADYLDLDIVMLDCSEMLEAPGLPVVAEGSHEDHEHYIDGNAASVVPPFQEKQKTKSESKRKSVLPKQR